MKQDFNEHYTSLEIEPIEIIKKDLSSEQYIGYLKGNIIKYTLRNKEPLKDASKCRKYAEWLEEAMEKQNRIPKGMGNLDYTHGSYVVEGIPLAIRKDGTTWCAKHREFETPEECEAHIKKTLEKRDRGYYVEWIDKYDEAEKHRMELLKERKRHFDNKHKNNN